MRPLEISVFLWSWSTLSQLYKSSTSNVKLENRNYTRNGTIVKLKKKTRKKLHKKERAKRDKETENDRDREKE